MLSYVYNSVSVQFFPISLKNPPTSFTKGGIEKRKPDFPLSKRGIKGDFFGRNDFQSAFGKN